MPLRYVEETTALRAALSASEQQPSNPQRTQDVLECVTRYTDALRRDGLLIEIVITELRQILRDYHAGLGEDLAIQHGIVQYYR